MIEQTDVEYTKTHSTKVCHFECSGGECRNKMECEVQVGAEHCQTTKKVVGKSLKYEELGNVGSTFFRGIYCILGAKYSGYEALEAHVQTAFV